MAGQADQRRARAKLPRRSFAARLQGGDYAFLSVIVLADLAWLLALLYEFAPFGFVSLSLAAIPTVAALIFVALRAEQRKRLLLFHEAIEKTPSAFALYDETDRLIACNQSYKQVHSAAFGQLRGPIYYEDLVRATLSQTLAGPELEEELHRRVVRQQEATGVATDRLYENGRWLRVSKARTESGGNVGIGIDVTEIYDAKAEIDRERGRFRGLAETLPVGIWHFDGEGKTVFVNRRLLELFGLDDASALDHVHALDFIAANVTGFNGRSRDQVDNDLGNLTIERDGCVTRHVMLRRSELPGAEPGGSEVIMSFIDVTALKEAEKRIDYLAHRDALTGARNRAAFGDAIETAARMANRANPCWIAAMDLDGFKPINDQHGHAAGDLLLQRVVARMNAARPPKSLLYRLGGDEFCLMITGSTRDEVAATAEAIVGAVSRPFDLGHVSVALSVSVGVACMPDDADDAGLAQHYADLALYAVKEAGGGAVAFFEPALAEREITARIMKLDLTRALAENEFTLAYQPLVNGLERRIVGVEALLRWVNRRTGATVVPGDFIPAAERCGIIGRIDMWVAGQVAEQISRWSDEGFVVPKVMVNMSPLTLQDRNFLGRIDDLLRRHPGLRDHLVIEITEGVAVSDLARLNATFHELKSRGIDAAIDDFGAGHTSMALLRDLPVGYIKIDRSYIANIETDRQSLAIVSSVLQLGRELGVKVVAEGVETESQLAALRDAGCDIVQGFVYGHPGVPEEMGEQFMRLSKARHGASAGEFGQRA